MKAEYLIIVVLITIIIVYIIKQKIRKIMRNRKFKKGFLGEIKAGKYLKKKGYEILEYQKELRYNYYVDKEQVEVRVRPDYIVKKAGKTYIAEVKTGVSAPNIKKNRDTRRQIMEYSFSFNYNGVLLVDIDNEKILKVEFKNPKQNIYISVIVILTLIIMISLSLSIMYILFIRKG
jgi:hypothetical protein